MAAYRDRILRFDTVPVSELRPDPRNWREHSDSQRSALVGILEQVGIVAPLVVREAEDGGYIIVDGHLRSDLDADAELPVVVTDLDERDAGSVLLTFDVLGTMVDVNGRKLVDLYDSGALDAANVELAKVLQDLATAQDEREIPPAPIGDPDDEFDPQEFATIRVRLPQPLHFPVKAALREWVQTEYADEAISVE